ncbi:uncharacterized protein LOC142224750 [Haematobia irritans]|uniref:uncharacterized protein LOC142224750 n=1 Tax=Haematobia irritans TaxID=7368 RepID=UPI003F4FBB69
MSLNRFIRVSDRLVEFEAHLNDKNSPLTSSYIIETHMEEIKTLWADVKLTYDQCLQDIDEDDKEEKDDDVASETETVKGKFKSAYGSFCRCNALLREALHEQSLSRGTQPSPQIVFSHTPNSEPINGFKLPPCEIPIFGGDFSAWPTFRDIFKAVCLNNPRLSAVEKLFHLNQRTKGEPHDIVAKFPLTNDNLDVAWKSLSTRYENKRVLVNIQLKNLFAIPAISSESGAALKKLQRDMNTCISLLKKHDIQVDTWDPIFTFICSNRLPDSTLTLWEQTLSDKTIIPKWSEMDLFLTNRHKTLESVSEIRKQDPSSTSRSKPPPGKSSNRDNSSHVKSFQNNVSEPKCRLCPKDNHIIRKCPKFLKMDPNKRFAEIKGSNLCINCFSKVHTAKTCTSKNSCRICGKRHNTLLHRPQNFQPTDTNSNANATPLPSSSSSLQSTNSSGSGIVHSCFTSSSRGVLLGTAVVKVCYSGLSYTARALVDSGSEGTFVSQKLFNMLKLPFRRTSAKISGLNNTISAAVQKECSFVLGSNIDENIEVFTTALVVPYLSGNLPSSSFDTSSLSDLPTIPLADPRFYESSKIDILLGADILPSILLPGLKRHICGSLMAQESVFGWILTGPIPNTATNNSPIVSYFCEISLDKEISRFWEVEDLPKKKFASLSDTYCEELYSRTTRRNNEGRYIVSLPFKESFPRDINIDRSRKIAIAQYFRNEARLTRTLSFKNEYDSVLEEYITLGHMTSVTPNTDSDNSKSYYLPHHAVIRPESVTTKVRVVFNASAPTSNGVSLNDILHTGPILQNELIILILNWRLFRFVFNGDITKMYRQILVDPTQTSFQRILFRKDPQDPLETFELKTVTFGVNCAPYLAIRTILQLADDVEARYPKASKILRSSMYVDDALVGSHTIPEAVESRNQLILALKSAGFQMRKWTSNSKSILADIPSSDLLNADFLEFDDSSTAKTLGIRWNARSDSFFFVVQEFPTTCSYTKREVLSQISKLFDPAGWLAPCIIVAKIIMQQVWIDATGWDEKLSPETLKKWIAFQSDYSHVNSIKIPRWFQYCPSSIVQLHGFSDASEKAYAATLYIRIKNNESVSTHLVASKTKVAPIKTLSIPRLELCGATLLAEMIDHIVPQLQIDKFSLHCWTDSTIVLSWLAKPPCFWTTFVANRVAKIVQVVSPSKWHHVPSEHNPSDLASRGISPQDLGENDLWWQGPHFLRNIEDNFPVYHQTDDIILEKKNVKVNLSFFTNFEDVLDNFSSLPRAIRVIAYMYRFLYRTHPKYRQSFHRTSKDISTFEVLLVHNKLQIMCQKACYPNEYMALSAKKNIQKSSSLLNLNPFLDNEGIMRVCGRLSSSPALTYNERHPIILPYNSQYSRLLVRFIHEVSLHGGNQLVLKLIRSQYWILKAKNLIKATINKCKPCVLYRRKCQTQLMSALPPQRSDFTRPFTHTGVDFAGPFDIKSYSGRACRISKGYTCVFICFSTKAIHLEATSELSTSAFLAAFSRFVSRRGCPLHLYSDNGTNFVGASRKLAKEFLQTSQQSVTSNYAHQNVTWHFIPPGAPHMGGLWEAGVKSFKSHFKKVALNFKHTFEEFQTLLSKIEACLNSRPLSPCSEEPSDLSALTPGHFLIGSPILVPIDPSIGDNPISIVNRWQRLKVIHQHFCLRWKEEYLKELHKRHKWKQPSENLQENAMVVIREENLPPNCWRLGRVTKVYPGADNRVRVAEVRTQKGIITRPITKLVVLPFENTP